MSEPVEPPTVQHSTKLTSAARQVVVAALAAGMTQTQAAKEFGLHRNTIHSIYKAVKAVDHPSNPLNAHWKHSAITECQEAFMRGVKHRKDPYKAATLAAKGLEGLGIFATGGNTTINNTVAMSVSWRMPEEPARDVTPVLDHNTNTPEEPTRT